MYRERELMVTFRKRFIDSDDVGVPSGRSAGEQTKIV